MFIEPNKDYYSHHRVIDDYNGGLVMPKGGLTIRFRWNSEIDQLEIYWAVCCKKDQYKKKYGRWLTTTKGPYANSHVIYIDPFKFHYDFATLHPRMKNHPGIIHHYADTASTFSFNLVPIKLVDEYIAWLFDVEGDQFTDVDYKQLSKYVKHNRLSLRQIKRAKNV